MVIKRNELWKDFTNIGWGETKTIDKNLDKMGQSIAQTIQVELRG